MPNVETKTEGPKLVTSVPGPQSHTWLVRARRVAAPMGPPVPPGPPQSIVFARGRGSNVWDADGNRFVDLAAGFGSLLLGHGATAVQRAIEVQMPRLMQAMGDVYPADAKVGLLEQLVELFPGKQAQGIVGQSGADAVSAALKTAVLHTGRAGVIAFGGAYHGLSYGPLAACGLRESYRLPFAEQLGQHVSWLPYPQGNEQVAQLEGALRELLSTRRFGAVLFEPVLGRGGVVPMTPEVASLLRRVTEEMGALLIADEIWTGLGRCGAWLRCSELEIVPDLVCLGKGLGGGLPISVCLGRASVMASWRQEREVVHTSTFAGAPLACAAALAVIDVLRRTELLDESRRVGAQFGEQLRKALPPEVSIRGVGMMWGVDVPGGPGSAWAVLQALLRRGYLVSTGGGQRETVVLTPPLNIPEAILHDFVPVFAEVLAECLG